VKPKALKFVVLGLSITSSWGNGHATTYRGLIKAMAARGHNVLFLERDVPWYAQNRDLEELPNSNCRIKFYQSINDLKERFAGEICEADFVMIGSYVPEGIEIGHWLLETVSGVTAFYDIDTPITLTNVERGRADYISRELIPGYQLYLSFTGGPILERLEEDFGSPMARALYCSVDPELYFPEDAKTKWDLGYLGTYSSDRQSALNRLLLEPARDWPEGRFVVAGPQYPKSINWPANVERIEHLSPAEHRAFYNKQKFTLNITRADMRRAGYSPSVRLFEAAACGTPIISDAWAGLENFFEPGKEIFVAQTADEAMRCLQKVPSSQRLTLGEAARQRVLNEHTAAHRAAELEQYAVELLHRRVRHLAI
jgi:spore maturation protein CgeB